MGFLLDFVYEHWKAFLVFGIIAVSSVVFTQSKTFGFLVAKVIDDKTIEIGNMTYDIYDGQEMKGSEVMNAIKRNQNEISVTVYTGESVDTYNGNFSIAKNDRKSEKYIKPSQKYYGSVIKDANKAVVGLVFAKEGVILTDTSYKELLAKILGADSSTTSMNDLVTQIGDLVKNKDATIQALNQNIASLNTSVSNLQTQNNSLQTQKNTLQTQNTSLSSQLSTANANYNALSSSVSTGKSQIASAITNKGVATSGSASFETMAANINTISAGTKCKKGTATNAQLGYRKFYYFQQDASREEYYYYLEITGVGFKPSFVYIKYSPSDTPIFMNSTGCYVMMNDNRYVKFFPTYDPFYDNKGSVALTSDGFIIPVAYATNYTWTAYE